eukprot:10674755-Alexandrium_andersonii.AAC.1
MSASLVGSEMCIRDSSPPKRRRAGGAGLGGGSSVGAVAQPERPRREPVSYTHLTLPTICSV